MKLWTVPETFAVCKVSSLAHVDWTQTFTFVAKTDEELSVVCPMQAIPENATDVEADWRCLKVLGPLDFSLVGIVSRLTDLLAKAAISVFVVSTFDTDYLLVKAATFDAAKAVLQAGEYEIVD